MGIINDFDKLRITLEGMPHPVVMWGYHSRFHAGHRQCAVKARELGKTVVGVHWGNVAEATRFLMGGTLDADRPIDPEEIRAAEQLSDIFITIQDDYPFQELAAAMEQVERELPAEAAEWQKEGFNYRTIKYSMAIRIVMHQYHGVKIDQYVGGGRDGWRHPYWRWCKERFGFDMHLLQPVTDHVGNNFSGSKNRMPAELRERITHRLLHPEFTALKQVQEHIQDIEGLTAFDFWQNEQWLGCTFCFGSRCWSEGIKR